MRLDLDGGDGEAGGGAPGGRQPPRGDGGPGEGEERDELREIQRRLAELERESEDPAEAERREQRRAASLLKRLKKLEEAVADRPELQDEIDDMRATLKALAGDVERLEGGEGAAERAAGITDAAGGHLGTAAAFLRNPTQGIANLLPRALGLLGPVGLAAIAALTAAAFVPEIVQALARKGWPLDRSWRRSVGDEVNGALDLRQQRDRLRGQDPFIIAQDTSFRPVDGTTVFNSLYRRDELRLTMTRQDERAQGKY